MSVRNLSAWIPVDDDFIHERHEGFDPDCRICRQELADRFARRSRASLRPLLTWALVMFLAGVLAGVLTTLLAQSALGGSSTTGKEAPIVAEPARAAARADLEPSAGVPVGETVSPAREMSSGRSGAGPGGARTTATDEGPASESAPQPSAFTTRQLRDDPAIVGRASPIPRSLTRSDIEAIITNAAVEFGQDPARMIAVAFCESSLRADALNATSGASGLMQFLPSTWAANAPRLGYGPGDIWDPVASSRVAAWMFARGQSGQWVCR